MKCVAGIDLERRCSSALALLGKLKLPIDETILVHATEPVNVTLPYSAYGVYAETTEMLDMLHEAGTAALEEAKETACQYGLHPKTLLCDGYPASTLMDVADDAGVDLIAVDTTVRGALGALFGGSVARTLAISAIQSILIAREEMPSDGPVRAVFATDHSEYSAECIRLLVQFKPMGISHMTLLCVHERAKHENLLSFLSHASRDEALCRTQKAMEQKNEEFAKWFSQNGISTSSSVVVGEVEESIQKFMEDSHADLLIVGSQGHGLLDRVMVGSTSLHEVIAERYPILILRLPGKKLAQCIAPNTAPQDSGSSPSKG